MKNISKTKIKPAARFMKLSAPCILTAFFLTACCDIPLVPFVKNNIEKNASQDAKKSV